MAGRHIRGELKSGMRSYLKDHGGGPATITEIRTALEQQWGEKIPQSSIRSGLQDTRYFERVSRGVFRSCGDQ